MSHIITTIGRGLMPVQVEYSIWTDTPDELSVQVDEVFVNMRPAFGLDLYKFDISNHLTDAVYESLEADCLAHEINVRSRNAAEPVESLCAELDLIGGY